MRARVRVVLVAVAMVALTAWARSGAAQSLSPGSEPWLDQPPANWNLPRASVPRAPLAEGAAANLTRCGESGRPPTLPADRAVRAAGWTLFGPAQVFGATTVIMAMSDADGMCRPLQYQAFVFVDGRFAGTLSPAPMNSRTDGALTVVRLFRASEIVAEFARYTSADALCCPSRTSTVTFRIERGPRGTVVAPASVNTTPLRS